MKINYGRNSFLSFERGQENCYMLTNGLGGYSSFTVIGSNARNDHALLMASLKAPNYRFHLVTKLEEKIKTAGEVYDLSCQQFAEYTKNQEGFRYLDWFTIEYLPVWTYRAAGITLEKTIVMKQDQNTLAIRYKFYNDMDVEAEFEAAPLLQFVEKGEKLPAAQVFYTDENKIESNGITLFYKTDGTVEYDEISYIDDLYYEYDARDGRHPLGCAAKNHTIKFSIPAHKTVVHEIIYSTDEITGSAEEMIEEEIRRQKMLAEISGLKDETARMIAKNCSQYVVKRDSTGGKSIIAGYPFFGDWGRDTMIALTGCCICTGRFEDAKSIFRTFMKYMKKGIMPNVFPEGENSPGYNTADASLLFILGIYEYYQQSTDTEFVIKEAYPAIKEIIDWYTRGTDYHIKMDLDGLIMAGSGLEQVTWMDVRINGKLPTPRHGKPVEINAYWYNALKIAELFAEKAGEDASGYKELSGKVKDSFYKKFWLPKEGYLKDVISESRADYQIRCNQIWAISAPFSILEREEEKRVVRKVFECLYTPYGLRTLDCKDEEFCEGYGGSLEKRDFAYHQGTVWTFPLGAYYLAYLKTEDYSKDAVERVKKQLEPIQQILAEGCAGHIAEIYDGLYPSVSRGCFAQAWSMGEILRVYKKIEEAEAGKLES